MRAELHLHTKLSDDISVIGVEEIIENAERLGLNAIAFTNLNNVQDFPEIARCAKKTNLKIIYGAQVCYKRGHRYYYATLLVKNRNGIKDLYKIISTLTTDNQKDYVDYNTLLSNRKNLLIGSCGNKGTLYKAIKNKYSEETISFYSRFFDFYEIHPANNKSERNIYKKIYKLGKTLGIPVVAAGNCHCISRQDAISREIVGFSHNLKISDSDKLYVRTTTQMLKEFSYLGKNGAYKAVIKNPSDIVNMVENVTPVREKFCGELCCGAYEQISKLAFDKANEIYGNPLPENVNQRLKTELSHIKKSGFASQYLIAHKIAEYVKEKGCCIGARGSFGSMLTAFLLGVSDTNPLPPHYHCPHCYYCEFTDDEADGFDLPDKICPVCNNLLKSDGHNMPYEIFMGYKGDKTPDIALVVPETLRLETQRFVEGIFGKKRVVQALAIHKAWKKTAENYINEYELIKNIKFTHGEREKIVEKITGVKCGCDVHPAGLMIIPDDMEFEDFTPINYNTTPRPSTHFGFLDLYNIIFKLNIIGSNTLDLLAELEKSMKKQTADIKWNDTAIYKKFQRADTSGIPEFDADFVRDLLLRIKPKNFYELVKISGLCHGTNVWTENGEKLIKNGVPVSELPCLRDDIMNDLISVGADSRTSYLCSENTRRGLLAKGRADPLIVKSFKAASESLGDWYFDYCSKIRYMFPKAHAVASVMNAIRLAWFKIYVDK